MTLHFNILPQIQQSLIEELKKQSFISDFYLAGGTCLALHLGHRESLDFDFFTQSDFDTSKIIGFLSEIGDYERENEEKNTINGRLNGVRISFFGYKYKIIEDFKIYEQVRLAGLRDISGMKLEAIAGRGSKKDFVDLYFLLKHYTLKEMFEFHSEKYGSGLNNQYHLLKSLVYFSDAESEVMPVMKEKVTWNQIKKEIILRAKELHI